MRVVPLALVVGLCGLFACASGFERNGDDDVDPRIDASGGGGGGDGGGGGSIDARIIDAPGQIVDAPMSSVDAPTTGGTDCPDTIDYYFKALDELSNNPNWVDCTSGSDCTTAQCCYGQLVCVAL